MSCAHSPHQDDRSVGWKLLGFAKWIAHSTVLGVVSSPFRSGLERRETGMSKRRWRESRMCDPFCKAQQFPTDAAISLNQILSNLCFELLIFLAENFSHCPFPLLRRISWSHAKKKLHPSNHECSFYSNINWETDWVGTVMMGWSFRIKLTPTTFKF